MPIFNYEGRNRTGEKINGSLKTETLETLMVFLSERGITPINVKEQKTYQNLFDWQKIFPKKKAGAKAVLNFSRQMATLLKAGMPIIKAVNQIAKSTKRNKTMQQILFGIAEGLESGNGLAKTLQNYQETFAPIFISIIEVAENTGQLDNAFHHLTLFLDKQMINRKRLISAIRYPFIVIGTAIAALLGINFFVIPKFGALFSSFGADLPTPTIILIKTSNFLTHNWLFMLVVVILSSIGLRYMLKIPKYRLSWDKFKLSIPVVGELQRRIILTQFSWTFGMILRSDVPILKGLNMIANLTNNTYITKKIFLIRDAIDHGETFTNAIIKSELFDDTSVQLIEVGDETGKLEEMFTKISEIYEEEVDYEIKNLNDLLEPILLAIIGGIVVILALGVYLPMWDIIKAVKQ